ncbi:MAG: hypothetical protein H6R17_636 [Proteobacteria bacterium]|nr:hypothetical protein [Pseudomonadota bacterium]
MNRLFLVQRPQVREQGISQGVQLVSPRQCLGRSPMSLELAQFERQRVRFSMHAFGRQKVSVVCVTEPAFGREPTTETALTGSQRRRIRVI